jgi:hypothetical protein
MDQADGHWCAARALNALPDIRIDDTVARLDEHAARQPTVANTAIHNALAQRALIPPV